MHQLASFDTVRSSPNFARLGRGPLVEYYVQGRGQPVVVVPGLAGGTELIRPVINELAKHFTVYAYELRGEKCDLFDRDYDLSRLADDLGDFIEALAIERPGIVASSFGSAIALSYVAKRARRSPAFLGLCGASLTFEHSLFGDVAKNLLGRMPMPKDNPFINQFIRILVGRKPEPGESFDSLARRCWRTDQSVMVHRLEILQSFDVSGEVDRIDTPTLVMAAENDAVVLPSRSRDLARSLSASSFVQIPKAGHLAFSTHAREVSRAIWNFTGRQLAN
jgi:pimeloyl-ACP methyl ester carboxylesterase